ncbi:MAG: hypothetical protein WBW62_06440 [Solirubrobacterales bacterium]
MRLASWLIAIFLVVLIGAAGMLDSAAGLLMLAPFATIFAVLLIGLYPGETAIAALAEIIHRSARTKRESWQALVSVTADLPVPAMVPGTLGSRAPPFGV